MVSAPLPSGHCGSPTVADWRSWSLTFGVAAPALTSGFRLRTKLSHAISPKFNNNDALNKALILLQMGTGS
ncbi:hypothetical protein SBV1_2300005 [Verrucomicrobia bacterium]|nr:hypothetical protein SBV1_2300005 [Verrucomicrobiota bacterium]